MLHNLVSDYPDSKKLKLKLDSVLIPSLFPLPTLLPLCFLLPFLDLLIYLEGTIMGSGVGQVAHPLVYSPDGYN